MEKTLTTCPYCGCGCNYYLKTDNGRLTGITPSHSSPVNQGRVCIKGWLAVDFVERNDRLTVPLIKENGEFREASWEEAVGLIAYKLQGIKNNFGSDALGVFGSAKCTNEENYLIMKFARAVLGTNNVDHCARLCHASTVAGLASTFGSGAMTNSINEVDKADFILVTGSNTTEQHPEIGSRIIKAVENGTPMVVVDPRKIALVPFAKLHLRQECGTDVAWLNGMMNVIIEEGLADRKFVEERTENYEKLKAVVADYTPERVEKITGIPADDLIKAARMYARADRAMIFYSMGITQHTSGVDNVRSCANLAMLTGNVGREGTGVNPLRGQNNVQGACDLGALPNVYTGYQKVSDPEAREKFSRAWDRELPGDVGLTITEMITAAAEGSLKGIYIMGENPMISDPDINHVEAALKNLDFLVVQDIFLTETAQLADVVLPGASYAEKDGTFTNTERRVQRINQAINPVGNARADWQIICQLAEKMNYPMTYSHPEEIQDEITELTPIYGGIVYERLNNWGLQWPCPDEDHPGTPYLHKGKFSRGKGYFWPAEHKDPAEKTSKEYPFVLTTGRTYFHWHTGTMTRRTPILHREQRQCYVEISPEDAENLGIKKGMPVTVVSRRGEIQPVAVITDRVPAGTVFIPFHFAEAAANVLTNPAVDPEAKIPEYKVCAVDVRRAA